MLGLPVDLVTSMTFGGAGLAELFITTAREGLTPAQRPTQPLAGSVFRSDPASAAVRAEEFSPAEPAHRPRARRPPRRARGTDREAGAGSGPVGAERPGVLQRRCQ